MNRSACRQMARQIDEIDCLDDKLDGFTLLEGAEVDVPADSRLDLPDKILSRFDLVVASVHYKFDLFRKAQTERIISAMDNRHVSILGHPTGRLIGECEAYEMDMEAVIAAARERGCHLELNADPDPLVDQARRGWLEVADVINAQPLSRLRKLLRR
jgi:DNA polymerase (family X)